MEEARLMQTEFGRLDTKSESLMYALIVEQRKTNELIQALLDKDKPVMPVAKKPQKEGV